MKDQLLKFEGMVSPCKKNISPYVSFHASTSRSKEGTGEPPTPRRHCSVQWSVKYTWKGMEHLQATNLKLSFLKFLVSLYMGPSTRRWLRALAAV